MADSYLTFSWRIFGERLHNCPNFSHVYEELMKGKMNADNAYITQHPVRNHV